MLCRFVFSLWWSVFVWGIWSHLRQPLHVWTVDRHDSKTVSVTQSIRPIEFANASVLWLDMLKDSVHLDLRKTEELGTVVLDGAEMLVFEDSFRDTVMERYDIIRDATSRSGKQYEWWKDEPSGPDHGFDY